MLADSCILGHIKAHFLGLWVIDTGWERGYLQERCKACLRPKAEAHKATLLRPNIQNLNELQAESPLGSDLLLVTEIYHPSGKCWRWSCIFIKAFLLAPVMLQ